MLLDQILKRQQEYQQKLGVVPAPSKKQAPKPAAPKLVKAAPKIAAISRNIPEPPRKVRKVIDAPDVELFSKPNKVAVQLSDTFPIIEPFVDIAQTVEQPAVDIAEPITQQTKEPAVDIAEPITQQTKEPAVDIAEPITQQTKEPAVDIAEPITQQTKEPVVDIAEPITQQTKEPVVDIAEPITQQTKEPVVDIAEPITQQTKEPAVDIAHTSRAVTVAQTTLTIEDIIEQYAPKSKAVEFKTMGLPVPIKLHEKLHKFLEKHRNKQGSPQSLKDVGLLCLAYAMDNIE